MTCFYRFAWDKLCELTKIDKPIDSYLKHDILFLPLITFHLVVSYLTKHNIKDEDST